MIIRSTVSEDHFYCYLFGIPNTRKDSLPRHQQYSEKKGERPRGATDDVFAPMQRAKAPAYCCLGVQRLLRCSARPAPHEAAAQRLLRLVAGRLHHVAYSSPPLQLTSPQQRHRAPFTQHLRAPVSMSLSSRVGGSGGDGDRGGDGERWISSSSSSKDHAAAAGSTGVPGAAVPPAPGGSSSGAFALIYASFAVTGLSANSFGPMLPAISKHVGLDSSLQVFKRYSSALTTARPRPYRPRNRACLFHTTTADL